MKHVNQITEAMRRQALEGELMNTPKPTHESISKDAAKVVNLLFKQLKAVYPAWRNAFPTDEEFEYAKKTWTMAFIENSISTIDQIKQGTRRARKSGSPFWPSVGEFIALCKPEDSELGIPDFEEAWQEAGTRNPLSARWSSGLVYQAAKATGFYKLRNEPEVNTKPIFKKHFERLAAEIRNGADMPAKPIPRSHRIEHVEHKLPKEDQLSKLNELRKVTGL